MSQQQPADSSSQLKLEDPTGPSVWEAAADHPVPASEWEYQMRKNLRDAAFTTLAYLPACTHMPVCAGAKCSAPTFVWVSACGRAALVAGCTAISVAVFAVLCTVWGPAGIMACCCANACGGKAGHRLQRLTDRLACLVRLVFVCRGGSEGLEGCSCPTRDVRSREGKPNGRLVEQQSARLPLFSCFYSVTKQSERISPVSQP
jgi:hypothetical protein